MVIDQRYPCLMKAYQNGDEVLYCLDGLLRMQNAEDVKRRIITVLSRDGIKTFCLNMALLTELDSAGLGVLVGLHMTARKMKKDFKILSPTAFQMRLLEGTRLTSILTIVTGIEAAATRSRLEKLGQEISIEELAD